MTTLFAPASSVEPRTASAETVSPSKASIVDTPIEGTEPQVNLVSIYASSIFAVTMLFFFGVGVPCWLFLDDALGGFGLGAMCAVWGGPSFGVMAGSARMSAWQEANHVVL